jgi:trehalose-6-phosphate synthase
VDYTKGIIERFQAVEEFLESHPRYQGNFTYIQIGAPSRIHIQRYADFSKRSRGRGPPYQGTVQSWQLESDCFSESSTQPSRGGGATIAAHLCMVTSLHDGMNLVAKEYVAARQDEREC